MESKFIKTILFLATISAAIFAGIQTLSSAGLFSLKQIQYDFIAINSSDEVTGKLSDVIISIKDAESVIQIKNPVFIDILIENTGNVDVPKIDFDGNIKFTFIDSKPLRVQQVSNHADSLITSPEISDNNVIIPPLLLNSGDSFVIRVLLDGTPTKIKPHFRFLGMDAKFGIMPEKNKFNRIDYSSIFMVIIAFAMIGRLTSILFLNVELHRRDILLSLLTVYTLGILLAKQTGHLSSFDTSTEIMFLFLPTIITCLSSWLISNNKTSLAHNEPVKQDT
ncbi:hypothetical protein [Pseudocolwellia agarivorans]|uniref:hypothetical protein n=1 Tax=Pseudocolwellia agarivorans TaxID=1911682 RepID=UPI003F88128E